MKHACKEISRLASDSLDRKLTLWEKLQFRMHLLICSNCRNCADSLKLMRHALALIEKTKYGNVRLSDTQRNKLKQALKKNTDH
ncbi:MAG: hypothetical protein CO187_03340 [Zetaproteobacteria bacterium CG_4_9_14_3_um_filter_53_7]|nr:MAG: hypothetical protein CO187_03340 [Zetaproteobacteria bacterium CG_4_9_14_3_um_filter_53_7]